MGENGTTRGVVKAITIPLSKEFYELTWTRYFESVRPYTFPLIDTLWFADERLLLAFYRMMTSQSMQIPKEAMSLEDIVEEYETTTFGVKDGEFEFYLETALRSAINELRLVHGIPEQQTMFLEEGVQQRMLSYLYPQREVW